MIASPLLRAATLGICLAFAAGTLTACDDEKSTEKTGKTIDDTTKKATTNVEKAGDAMKDAARNAAGQVAETAKKAAEEAEKAASAMKAAAAEVAREIGDKVNGAMEKAGDKIEAATDAMRDSRK